MPKIQAVKRTKVSAQQQQEEADACLKQLNQQMTLQDVIDYLSSAVTTSKERKAVDAIVTTLAATGDQTGQAQPTSHTNAATAPLAAAAYLYLQLQYLSLRHAGIVR